MSVAVYHRPPSFVPVTTLAITETSAPPRRSNNDVVTLDGVAMTVPYRVAIGCSSTSTTSGGAEAAAVREATAVIEQVFATAEGVFSPFVPHSELFRLNRPDWGRGRQKQQSAPPSTSGGAAGELPRRRIRLSPWLSDVVRLADALHDLSGGLFDPTVSAPQLERKLVAAAERNGDDVTAEQHRAAANRATAIVRESQRSTAAVAQGGAVRMWRRHVALRPIEEVGGNGGSLEIDMTEGLLLDLSGISKGYIVDQLLRSLVHDAGFENAYVDWGGDVAVAGTHPSGRPWCAGISRPAQTLRRAASLARQLTMRYIARADQPDRQSYHVNNGEGAAADFGSDSSEDESDTDGAVGAASVLQIVDLESGCAVCTSGTTSMSSTVDWALNREGSTLLYTSSSQTIDPQNMQPLRTDSSAAMGAVEDHEVASVTVLVQPQTRGAGSQEGGGASVIPSATAALAATFPCAVCDALATVALIRAANRNKPNASCTSHPQSQSAAAAGEDIADCANGFATEKPTGLPSAMRLAVLKDIVVRIESAASEGLSVQQYTYANAQPASKGTTNADPKAAMKAATGADVASLRVVNNALPRMVALVFVQVPSDTNIDEPPQGREADQWFGVTMSSVVALPLDPGLAAQSEALPPTRVGHTAALLQPAAIRPSSGVHVTLPGDSSSDESCDTGIPEGAAPPLMLSVMKHSAVAQLMLRGGFRSGEAAPRVRVLLLNHAWIGRIGKRRSRQMDIDDDKVRDATCEVAARFGAGRVVRDEAAGDVHDRLSVVAEESVAPSAAFVSTAAGPHSLATDCEVSDHHPQIHQGCRPPPSRNKPPKAILPVSDFELLHIASDYELVPGVTQPDDVRSPCARSVVAVGDHINVFLRPVSGPREEESMLPSDCFVRKLPVKVGSSWQLITIPLTSPPGYATVALHSESLLTRWWSDHPPGTGGDGLATSATAMSGGRFGGVMIQSLEWASRDPPLLTGACRLKHADAMKVVFGGVTKVGVAPPPPAPAAPPDHPSSSRRNPFAYETPTPRWLAAQEEGDKSVDAARIHFTTREASALVDWLETNDIGMQFAFVPGGAEAAQSVEKARSFHLSPEEAPCYIDVRIVDRVVLWRGADGSLAAWSTLHGGGDGTTTDAALSTQPLLPVPPSDDAAAAAVVLTVVLVMQPLAVAQTLPFSLARPPPSAAVPFVEGVRSWMDQSVGGRAMQVWM